MKFDLEILASATPQKSGIVEVTTSFLEEYFNVSRQTINNWEKEGCPKRGHGRWNFIEVLQWRGELNNDEDKNVNWNLEKIKADTMLKQKQAELAEIELQRQRGEIIEIEKVKEIASDIIVSTKNLLLAVPSKVAPHIAGISVLEDFSKLIVANSEKLIKANNKKDVEKIAKDIIKDLYDANSIVEINEIVKNLIYEALENLSELVGE